MAKILMLIGGKKCVEASGDFGPFLGRLVGTNTSSLQHYYVLKPRSDCSNILIHKRTPPFVSVFYFFVHICNSWQRRRHFHGKVDALRSRLKFKVASSLPSRWFFFLTRRDNHGARRRCHSTRGLIAAICIQISRQSISWGKLKKRERAKTGREREKKWKTNGSALFICNTHSGFNWRINSASGDEASRWDDCWFLSIYIWGG